MKKIIVVGGTSHDDLLARLARCIAEKSISLEEVELVNFSNMYDMPVPTNEVWHEVPSAKLPTEKAWFSKFSGKHGKPPRW